MKRLMNAVEAMLDESLDGFAAAHADIVELRVDRKFVRRRALSRGKVALISGGGSGHEPLHAGFVGRGMLDAACPGQVFTSPTPDQIVAAIERTRPAFTADGTPIAVCINIADPAEVETLDPGICDGIGLVRMEFLFGDKSGLPDEETQYRAYRRLAEWAAGKPVTICTLGAGADKPIAGLTLDHEANPFLGMRGIRLSLAKPEIFRTQLRALCRAAAHGAVEIMVPMVALPRELELARGHLEEALSGLQAAGLPCRRPDLGIMVEVPAAAITVEAFDAAFFSIGSNDLTQYVMAAARDSDAVAELNNPSASGRLASHRASRSLRRKGRPKGKPVRRRGGRAEIY